MHNLKKKQKLKMDKNKYKKYTTPISNKNWEKASNTMEDSYITVFDYNSWQIYQYKKFVIDDIVFTGKNEESMNINDWLWEECGHAQDQCHFMVTKNNKIIKRYKGLFGEEIFNNKKMSNE
jgi:hypothetical protein